jgi:hypothetical protein
VPKIVDDDTPPEFLDEAEFASLSTERQILEVKVDARPFYWEPEPKI